jgi:hypothetical protein
VEYIMHYEIWYQAPTGANSHNATPISHVRGCTKKFALSDVIVRPLVVRLKQVVVELSCYLGHFLKVSDFELDLGFIFCFVNCKCNRRLEGIADCGNPEVSVCSISIKEGENWAGLSWISVE